MKTRTMQMDDIGREDAPPGSRDWCSRVRLQIAMRLYEAKSTVSQVRFSLKSMRDERHFTKLEDRHGRDFETWEAFCSSPRPWGLEIPRGCRPDHRRARRWSAGWGDDRDDAGAVPLAGHGEIGNGRGRVDDVKSTQGGNSAPISPPASSATTPRSPRRWSGASTARCAPRRRPPASSSRRTRCASSRTPGARPTRISARPSSTGSPTSRRWGSCPRRLHDAGINQSPSPTCEGRASSLIAGHIP